MEIMKTLTIGGNTYEIADEKMRKALEDGGVITKVETTVDSLTGKVSNKFTLSNGDTFTVADGASGVYVGSGTPPANATVWINPEGEPTSTEDWEFDLDDGSTEEKTVVVVGSDDATANGKLAILRMKDVNGNWVEIPAIVGTPGKDGEDGYTPQKGVDYFDGTNGKSAYQYAKDGGFTGTEAEFMALLNSIDDKANKADIATTVSKAMSNSALAYTKISGFGAWGNGAWYEKGFSMLITSRAGELVWVAVSSDDSNTNAKAIRLLNTYSKINAIYYSASESAIYVATNAWCNNVNAHILSNVNGDYVPTIATASALASDAVKITITEFGASSGATNIGDSTRTVAITGSGDRPTYNSNDMALFADIAAALAPYLPLAGGAITGVIDASGTSNVLDFGVTGWIRGQTSSGGKFDIFGYSTPTELQIGGSYPALAFKGKNARPTYNGANMALQSEVPTTKETWTFTLEDGSTVTKAVYVG